MSREEAEQHCTEARRLLDEAAIEGTPEKRRRDLAQKAILELMGVPGDAANLLRRSAYLITKEDL